MAKQPIESAALTDVFDNISEQWDIFMENHQELTKGNKQSAKRARAALGEIKKLITPYRKESTAAAKSTKKV